MTRIRSVAVIRLLSAAALVGSVFATPGSASAEIHTVHVGLPIISAYVTTWWHTGYGYNLDLVRGDTTSPAGMSVYWKSYTSSASPQGMRVRVVAYTGSCTGHYADITNRVTGAYIDRYLWVHINPALTVGSVWVTAASGWTSQFLGSVSSTQPASCVNAIPPL